MQITRNSLDSTPGPSDWSTGTVFIDAVAAPAGSARVSSASVHFTPGARTAWHVHPHGQTIFVTEGIGLCQREGENHWHGASPRRFMTHIAIQEADESGSPVTWGKQVTDDEYCCRPAGGTVSA
jgi:quercetin dioxygenase-like cupin family protein